MASKTFWRLPEVMARTGLSRSSIYSKVSEGEFPPPVNIGPRAVAWISDEVIDWQNDRIEQSRPGAQQ